MGSQNTRIIKQETSKKDKWSSEKNPQS